MTTDGWRDRIVGDRMQVDGSFADRVRQSQFSQPQWNLIMTAVDLEIQGEGDSARLVADASNVRHVLPELERFGANHAGGSGAGQRRRSGGLLSSVLASVGLGSSADDQTLEAAGALADEYATALQTHLERSGRWEQIVEAAAQKAE